MDCPLSFKKGATRLFLFGFIEVRNTMSLYFIMSHQLYLSIISDEPYS